MPVPSTWVDYGPEYDQRVPDDDYDQRAAHNDMTEDGEPRPRPLDPPNNRGREGLHPRPAAQATGANTPITLASSERRHRDDITR